MKVSMIKDLTLCIRQEIVSIENLVLELEQKIDLNLGERLNKHYISKIRMFNGAASGY